MKRLALILTVLSTMSVIVGISSAQDEANRRDVRGGLVREVIQAASDETGLEPSEILAQLAPDGATLADVIVANGGSVDAVINTAVNSATERINEAVANGNATQERADKLLANLEQLITDGINGEFSFNAGTNPRRDIERALITSITESTGMNAQSIIQEIRNGSTLADVIVDNGSSVDEVLASAMAISTERVNGWVENERITQEQADEILTGLEQVYTDILNGEVEFPRRDRGDRDNRDRSLGIIRKIAQDTGLTAQELVPQLRDGVTPAQILTDNGINVDTFIDELLVNTEERLATAVDNERITQEQADERLTTIRTTLTDRLNSPVNQRGTMPPETESGS
jgi:uncharacterized protein YidB (DUF937 family)